MALIHEIQADLLCLHLIPDSEDLDVHPQCMVVGKQDRVVLQDFPQEDQAFIVVAGTGHHPSLLVGLGGLVVGEIGHSSLPQSGNEDLRLVRNELKILLKEGTRDGTGDHTSTEKIMFLQLLRHTGLEGVGMLVVLGPEMAGEVHTDTRRTGSGKIFPSHIQALPLLMRHLLCMVEESFHRLILGKGQWSEWYHLPLLERAPWTEWDQHHPR